MAAWTPVDFTSVEVDAEQRTVTVKGDATRMGSREGFKLEPRHYVSQPDYWEIDMLWDATDTIFPSMCPYTVTLSLQGAVGTCGIEVIGKKLRKKVNVPPAPPTATAPKSN
jgi:hypothetical protein